MSSTIIDSLVVELGLDPKQFIKGKNEANSALKDTTNQVTASAATMVSGLRRVAAEFAALFLAVRSFKDVVGYMTQLNESTRQLGIDARNTGESAATLKDLGNAAEIAGGKAQDAQDTVLGLQKSIFNAQHGLGWSDQLTEFARLGVDTGVNTGEMRPIVDILRETAKALEQQYPDKAQRYQETQVLGLPGGIANLVGQGSAEFERLWKEQQSIPQVTPGQTGAAQRLTESYDLLKQRIEAIARQVLTAIEPALEKLFKGIGDFLQKHTADISQGIETLLGWFSGDGPQHVVDGLVAIGDAAATVAGFITGKGHFDSKGTLGKIFGDKPFFGGEMTDAEKKYGLPIGTLDREDLNSPSRNNRSMEQTASEIAQWHQDLGGDKGDPDYKASIRAFEDQYGIQPKPPSLWQRQADWFRNGGPVEATAGAESSPAARATAAGVGYTPTNTGVLKSSGVHFSIDQLNVVTQATDAPGISHAIVGALERKATVTFADRALS